MELNMPGWIVSPRSLKSHMTAPQHSAAKMENCVASGGRGLPGAAVVFEYGVFARARKEATTREQTYKTIWEDATKIGTCRLGSSALETHLLVHSGPLTEHHISTNQPGDEGVEAALLPAVHLLLNKQECLVQ